jgi:uncharacterized protein with von Willebrand factor type A (vWA) domain
MSDLSTELYKPAATVLYTLLTGCIAIILYFLRDIRQSIKEKHQVHDQSIDELKDDLAEFKAILPQEYVQKDDFHRVIREMKDDQARAITGLEHKVEILTRDVREMMQEIGKHMGIGGKNTC